jgi:hypothetical protein
MKDMSHKTVSAGHFREKFLVEVSNRQHNKVKVLTGSIIQSQPPTSIASLQMLNFHPKANEGSKGKGLDIVFAGELPEERPRGCEGRCLTPLI